MNLYNSKISPKLRVKDGLRTFQPENGQKFKNSEPQSKFTGSYKKCIVTYNLE